MRASEIGEVWLHIVPMNNEHEAQAFSVLLDEVRGGAGRMGRESWSQWAERMDTWVEAYPAFGAGRLLRAKTAREIRALNAADRLAEAAVFSSEPGRLFDLLFRAGIESEIASFARAVEALEPEVEEAIRLRWHPEQTEEVDDVNQAVESVEDESGEEGQEVEQAEDTMPVEVPEEGTLAREVVLGAIERSIEREIEEVRKEDADAAQASEQSLSEELGSPDRPSVPAVDVSSLSPLARWAFERSRDTGFVESAESGEPARVLRRAAEEMEAVMEGASDGVVPPEGGLEQQAALIDLFIRNEPTIGPIQPDVERPNIKELAKESLVEDASLITETMARIYAAQGQIGRARRAYKLLALKYPEKSVYFAAQSKKLGRKATDD